MYQTYEEWEAVSDHNKNDTGLEESSNRRLNDLHENSEDLNLMNLTLSNLRERELDR